MELMEDMITALAYTLKVPSLLAPAHAVHALACCPDGRGVRELMRGCQSRRQRESRQRESYLLRPRHHRHQHQHRHHVHVVNVTRSCRTQVFWEPPRAFAGHAPSH